METVTSVIDALPIDDAQKASLKSAVDAAKDNPALLQPVLDGIKGMMGN